MNTIILSFISIITILQNSLGFKCLRGSQYTDQALNDKIYNLPGLIDEINFNQFSGYLNLPNTKKYIHYWFVESEEDAENAPLVFWTNGGPGCSGLIGFMTEQGPFKPDQNGELIMNEWRWNKIANMVFLEQPIGVGFSYSENKDDYKIGDKQTAKDNLQTILTFLDIFPQYKNSSLFITSESYGGHYMPTLAVEIIKYNIKNPSNELKFRGLAVGNPYTNYYSGIGAEMETFWGKQLIPKPSWDKYVDNGCLNMVNQLNSTICTTFILDFMKKIGNLNPYALDYPICTTAQQVWTTDMIKDVIKKDNINNKFIFQYRYLLEITNKIFNSVKTKEEYEPCEDNYALEYLNNYEVKKSIHVNTDIEWSECSRTVKYDYIDKMVPMERYYNEILDSVNGSKVRVLVYSGDDDSVCGTIGTQKWIWDLGYSIRPNDLWRAWYVDGQTAGYINQFITPYSYKSRLTFATVHFAGHEVPTYKPKEAFCLFQAFLEDNYTFEYTK